MPSPSKPPKLGRPLGKFTQFRKLDRLRELLESHPSGLTLEQIGSLLHVTVRSVRRYLEELERVTQLESVPTSPGGPHLWRIKPSERGRALLLRRTQAYGLLATRRVFDVMRGSALYDELDLVTRQLLLLAHKPQARAPLRGELRSDQRLEERLVYLPHPPRNYAQRGEDLDALFLAVAELRHMVFRPRPTAASPARGPEVTIFPYALVIHRGSIYCVGGTPGSSELSVVAFDRMQDLAILERNFSLPEDFDVEACIDGEFGISASPKKTRVLIEFDARIADEIRARKVHPTQRVATAPDGRVRLSMSVGDLDEVRRWVLAFGPNARVVEPGELVDAVRESLRSSLERYRTV
jgi:predicted DNA-binding transcriptional regulator YafY